MPRSLPFDISDRLAVAATQATAQTVAPAAVKARTASSAVAPVVTMSSTTMTGRPRTDGGFATSSAPARLA
jgi:hypothetical protein